MGSLINPKPWVPYMNTKDCSQGFCSLYCPQWCYIIFPPPPPIEFPGDNSGPNFSPLVIAIIGILASAFLLVSYYAIISKYCKNMDSPRSRESHEADEELEDHDDPSTHESWHGANAGLDEALIKSITVCRYKKGDGFIDGTDCPVCLSEFQDSESLRLLPKCSHAFHVACIDTWLKSHSNCPLCRANIVPVPPPQPLPMPLPTPLPPEAEPPATDESLPNNNENLVEAQDIEMGISGKDDLDQGDTVIEIGEEEGQEIRRSVSMDDLCQGRVSIADVLRLKQDEDGEVEGDVGSSKRPAGETSKCGHRNSGRALALHCVTSPVAMKRSFSGGAFSFSRRGRGKSIMIPL
ncbi:E3 ubiquitin-protein ligase Os04g0590900-like [Diospyros lotus]|uniref:E3 ubiquitin-protein ligase Os04g0590900-like n=1 Tax=Diospyros lotus TaxID=55363 RepID=UPI00225580DC|nr:E3 ubiquitin-protein ligase Os04g0590900-like [Diospyros lotus]